MPPQAKRRGGVATYSLQHRNQRDNSLAQLLCNQEAVFFTLDDKGCHLKGMVAQTGQALRCLLEQAVITS